MMLRRCTGTIHYGHLDPDKYSDISEYFDAITQCDWEGAGFHAGAFALEVGEKTNRLHIQFYVEHKRKRLNTLVHQFDLGSKFHAAVFDVVRDAQGSWEYCSGTGKYEGKKAAMRFKFGNPKLFGTSAKADLKVLVDLVISGDDLNDIMRSHPYSFCVHQNRIVPFYHRWNGTPDDTIG